MVAPNNIGLDSERFLAFIPLSPSVASVWMDTIVSAGSFPAESWLEGAGAVAAENQVIDLLCRAAGMPAGAAGCFMSGGSIGNLSALAVGRERAVGRRFVAVADTAHASVDNALHLLGLEPLIVPTGPDCRLTGEALRVAIGDRTDVGIIAATAGSTNAGVIDDLAGCADVAAEIDAWFHVDGAYGLAALLLPEFGGRFAGLDRADSFIVDPHKWLFATGGSCALVYREPALARQVHTQHGPYIDVLRTGEDAYNPCDLGYQLTRRASGLPIWFALALHGVDAHRDAIRRGIRLAAAMAAALDAHPLTELIMPPRTGRGAVPAHRLGTRRVEGVGDRSVEHPHRVRRAVDLQGRAGRPIGVHAPADTGFDHRPVDAQLVSVTSPRGVAITARSSARLPSCTATADWTPA